MEKPQAPGNPQTSNPQSVSSIADLISRSGPIRPDGLDDLTDCKKLSVLIPRDLHRDLKTFAFRNQSTITDILLAVIVELLESEKHRSIDDNNTDNEEQIAS
jgi:hypothetical protein